MATGAANMRSLARQLENVPDDSVAELVRWFVPRSEQIGGLFRFGGGRAYQLSSRIAKRRARGGKGPAARVVGASSSVMLVGTPPGAWVMKSYGRRGDYTTKVRRARSLNLSSVAPDVFRASAHIERGTTGDKRWDRLVAEANDKFPDVVAELVDRGVMF